MRFVNDLAAVYPWATPAPIGYVEPGWVAIVADLLANIDRVMSSTPGATLDILGVRELCGALHVSWVLDGGSDRTRASIADAIATARHRSTQACLRCGSIGPSPRHTIAMATTTRCAVFSVCAECDHPPTDEVHSSGTAITLALVTTGDTRGEG